MTVAEFDARFREVYKDKLQRAAYYARLLSKELSAAKLLLVVSQAIESAAADASTKLTGASEVLAEVLAEARKGLDEARIDKILAEADAEEKERRIADAKAALDKLYTHSGMPEFIRECPLTDWQKPSGFWLALQKRLDSVLKDLINAERIKDKSDLLAIMEGQRGKQASQMITEQIVEVIKQHKADEKDISDLRLIEVEENELMYAKSILRGYLTWQVTQKAEARYQPWGY